LNQIIPAGIKYQKTIVDNLQGLKSILSAEEYKNASKHQLEIVMEISEHINVIKSDVWKMTEERKNANNLDSAKKQAIAYCDKVKPYFDTIRYHVDKLELIVDDMLWTLPKYRELLNLR